jgi:hypothetical protein
VVWIDAPLIEATMMDVMLGGNWLDHHPEEVAVRQLTSATDGDKPVLTSLTIHQPAPIGRDLNSLADALLE